ncbi:14013_t:CDS:2 [Rhizophagus irregularis]|nr:14013_t:CDS:2 [Rhizophagus irregularis]
MATVNEGLLRFGNWIIMYDLGASALTSSYGTHATAYRQVTDALTSNGNPHVIDIRIAIQASPLMVMTGFVRGGPFPPIPLW